ncbi:retroviral-like aspartic protease family protein [Spirulina subsalsa FACHB-351]|uniref:Retroviral-like aspartic protease family protein n=1 Tax=Spirulina subsalsa FACHB-351 TaxID=234711 RepID=A0ABT3L999_9CYAN|nr:retropepsin-like aspartic protease [Spirulina subsalsa]MCW6037674.1 retroviral-like aspartic protease family protein [Spirulina subsalsa FACHB-351]
MSIIVSNVVFARSSWAIDTPDEGSLNGILRQAICAQDWNQAIRAINEMKSLAPNYAARLTVYQSRLQTLASRNVFVLNWNCEGGGLPTVTEGSPESPVVTIPPPDDRRSFEIPIKRRVASIPVVDVRFNGESYEMLFDTGATTTMILPSMARQLNMQSLGKSRVTVADGRTIEVDVGRVSELQLGELIVENVMVTFGNRTNERGMGNMGLLGQNVFGDYDVTIMENVIKLTER